MREAMDRRGGVIVICVVGAALLANGASGQVMNPADAQSRPSTNRVAAGSEHLRSWEMPEIVVAGKPESTLKEEDLVGPYAQPRWTATRRFPTTRVYIVPEGKMEFEYWLRTTIKSDGSTAYRSLYEVELGLPHRLQFDIYLRTDESAETGEIFMSEQLEIRYALADWGRIPGNPTLYFEWIRHDKRDEPDQVEPKILFGGEICQRWHWGLNFVGEFQTGGELEREYSVRGGVSYTAIDSKLSLGAECQASFTDTEEDRGNFEESVVLGPSIQFRPYPQLTVNAAPLFGLTDESPRAQIWFNCGWEF